MTRAAPVPETLTVHVPFEIAKRGGRKEIRPPPGALPQCRLDDGEVPTIKEQAWLEKIAPSYLARLTLLALDLV